MRVDRDRLTFLAICAIEQVRERVGAAPITPDFSLRLVLAYLYAVGYDDRSSTDAFWKALREDLSGHWSDTEAKIVRAGGVHSSIEGIIRSLRLPFEELVRHDVTRALRGPPPHPSLTHDRLIAQMRRERRELAEGKRRRKDCGWL